MQLTAIGWNLFHGRDFPPDPALFTWRSRLLRVGERNATHVQVNRDLAAEFAALLAAAEWDVALLQECPPRFAAPLARACGAAAHRALTSRNSLGALRTAAARLNPDLIASAEGGSNLTLVRAAGPPGGIVERREVGGSLVPHPTPEIPQRRSLVPDGEGKKQGSGGGGGREGRGALGRERGGIGGEGALGGIVERRELVIHEGRPERRVMAFTRIAIGAGNRVGAGTHLDARTHVDATLCVANLHASAHRPELAAEDVLRAAAAASEWAGEAPLLFGGDLNLRPRDDPAVFEQLRARFGLEGPTAPDAIDHLLVRGLEVIDRPTPWPPERREVRERALDSPTAERPIRDGGLALRLSDHAPVEARWSLHVHDPQLAGMR